MNQIDHLVSWVTAIIDTTKKCKKTLCLINHKLRNFYAIMIILLT